MPRVCTVCAHSQRQAIETALVSGTAIRTIADTYGLSRQAVTRHRDNHLPVTLLESHAAVTAAHADTLAGRINALITEAEGLIAHGKPGEKAGKAVSVAAWAAGIGEARKCLELLAKLHGRVQDGVTVNLALDAGWIALRAEILTALYPYPDARIALAEVLKNGD